MSIEEDEDKHLDFEDTLMSFLPSQVAQEVNSRNESHRERRHGFKLSAIPLHSKNSWKPQQIKPIFSGKSASGGPGMQAIFLDFDRKCCGTGVFLPQRAGTNFQPGKKPACYPVLLPCRVVQALNLDVHERLHVSPRQGVKIDNDDKSNTNNNAKAGECNAVGNKTGREASILQSSEKIFLPKEWTY